MEMDRSLLALKARNDVGRNRITTIFCRHFLFRAFSAFQNSRDPYLGRCPQAVTFRAFGAGTRSFHTLSSRPGRVNEVFASRSDCLKSKDSIVATRREQALT